MSNWTCLVKHKWNTLLLFPSFNFSSQVLHKSCKMKQDLRSSWKFTDYTSRWMSSKQQQQITENNETALLKTGLNYNVNLTWNRGTCEGQAWCNGESCLTESPGHGFEAASPQILRGEGLPRFFPSLDPAHVGASGTRSALMHRHCFSSKKNYLIQLYLHKVVSSQ